MTQTPTKSPTKNAKKTPELDRNCFQFEILELVSSQRSNTKKVEILKKYENNALKSLFIWNFDQSIISLLPDGEVPYGNLKTDASLSGNLSNKISNRNVKDVISYNGTEENIKTQKTSIRNEYEKFFNFVKGGNDSLSTLRRELMFINILEGLHPKEAEILILVKDKKLSNKYKISFENVKDAYPDIVWGNR
jgi:hypothetical protein